MRPVQGEGMKAAFLLAILAAVMVVLTVSLRLGWAGRSSAGAREVEYVADSALQATIRAERDTIGTLRHALAVCNDPFKAVAP